MPARLDGSAAYVLDLSLTGVRFCHHELLRPGADCEIEFEYDGALVNFTARVQWSRLRGISPSAATKPLYDSGGRMTAAAEETRQRIRTMIQRRVERALEEQKANARGIPPPAAAAGLRPSPARFARHEFVDGVWRTLITTEHRQPRSGFTIAAQQPQREVEMLRSAYAAADDSLREVIRRLADLSITLDEPIPIRSYFA